MHAAPHGVILQELKIMEFHWRFRQKEAKAQAGQRTSNNPVPSQDIRDNLCPAEEFKGLPRLVEQDRTLSDLGYPKLGMATAAGPP